MKSVSKNMSASLRGQSPGGAGAEPIRVGKQTAPTAAGMTIPGEAGVSNPPGTPPVRSVKDYAGAVGGHFGGGR